MTRLAANLTHQGKIAERLRGKLLARHLFNWMSHKPGRPIQIYYSSPTPYAELFSILVHADGSIERKDRKFDVHYRRAA